MHISINTDEGLSDLDKKVLQALIGESPAPAATAAEKPAPAAKKTTAPKATPKAEEPAEDPADDADESTGEGATLEEAVALATKMVSNGEAAKVKAALGKVGAKKVSEIPEAKVDEFIAELS